MSSSKWLTVTEKVTLRKWGEGIQFRQLADDRKEGIIRSRLAAWTGSLPTDFGILRLVADPYKPSTWTIDIEARKQGLKEKLLAIVPSININALKDLYVEDAPNRPDTPVGRMYNLNRHADFSSLYDSLICYGAIASIIFRGGSNVATVQYHSLQSTIDLESSKEAIIDHTLLFANDIEYFPTEADLQKACVVFDKKMLGKKCKPYWSKSQDGSVKEAVIRIPAYQYMSLLDGVWEVDFKRGSLFNGRGASIEWRMDGEVVNPLNLIPVPPPQLRSQPQPQPPQRAPSPNQGSVGSSPTQDGISIKQKQAGSLSSSSSSRESTEQGQLPQHSTPPFAGTQQSTPARQPRAVGNTCIEEEMGVGCGPNLKMGSSEGGIDPASASVEDEDVDELEDDVKSAELERRSDKGGEGVKGEDIWGDENDGNGLIGSRFNGSVEDSKHAGQSASIKQGGASSRQYRQQVKAEFEEPVVQYPIGPIAPLPYLPRSPDSEWLNFGAHRPDTQMEGIERFNHMQSGEGIAQTAAPTPPTSSISVSSYSTPPGGPGPRQATGNTKEEEEDHLQESPPVQTPSTEIYRGSLLLPDSPTFIRSSLKMERGWNANSSGPTTPTRKRERSESTALGMSGSMERPPTSSISAATTPNILSPETSRRADEDLVERLDRSHFTSTRKPPKTFTRSRGPSPSSPGTIPELPSFNLFSSNPNRDGNGNQSFKFESRMFELSPLDKINRAPEPRPGVAGSLRDGINNRLLSEDDGMDWEEEEVDVKPKVEEGVEGIDSVGVGVVVQVKEKEEDSTEQSYGDSRESLKPNQATSMSSGGSSSSGTYRSDVKVKKEDIKMEEEQHELPLGPIAPLIWPHPLNDPDWITFSSNSSIIPMEEEVDELEDDDDDKKEQKETSSTSTSKPFSVPPSPLPQRPQNSPQASSSKPFFSGYLNQ